MNAIPFLLVCLVEKLKRVAAGTRTLSSLCQDGLWEMFLPLLGFRLVMSVCVYSHLTESRASADSRFKGIGKSP